MPKSNATFNTASLKDILPQLLQKVDISSLFSLLRPKTKFSPDYFVGKTVKQLTTLRDEKLLIANILDYAINTIENVDLSKFSPANLGSFTKPKMNLTKEELFDKSIDFLTTLKNYSVNKPDFKAAASKVYENQNFTDTIKNNFTKSNAPLNLENYIDKLTEILGKLKTMNYTDSDSDNDNDTDVDVDTEY